MNVIELTKELINKASVTPVDAGCQQLLGERLTALGFQVAHLRFGDVDNLWAQWYSDNTTALWVFAGHTDVVPAGDESRWHTPPFQATEKEGLLYGRGASDMKGGVAAMVVACEQFLAQQPKPPFNIGFLITGDEEGVAINGTVKVLDWLKERGQKIDWCVLGEPSSQTAVADEIKVGRRGSLTGRLTINGQQGHVAYPHLADNPIHRIAPLLAQWSALAWDNGNEFFPPTGFQITAVQAGAGADNVIPASIAVTFNFRYGTALTAEGIQQKIVEDLQQHQLDYQLSWHYSGAPFLTQTGLLLAVAQQAIVDVCGYAPKLSTSGGTSDGRFIAATGAQVLECGVSNATIHKSNESVAIADLYQLVRIYHKMLQGLSIAHDVP